MLRLSDEWSWAKGFRRTHESYTEQIAASLLSSSVYAVGVSMIFIKDGCTEFLDHNVNVFYDANATLIQAHSMLS